MGSEAVLFVDDEKNLLRAVERIFDDTGIRVLKAENADQAMKLIETEEIAVLVSDNIMPGTTGVELLAKARIVCPDAVRILMTAQADLRTAIEAINSGEVFRFIEKPWNDDVFKNSVMEGIDRYRIVRALKKADEPTMLSLAQTIELKDQYTRGHCDRVAEYALLMADALGLAEEIKGDIRYGSWLHDCGKIGIPESILNKEGPLDNEEFEMIKKHPVWGADVARQANLSSVIINIVLHHHERYDGTGYPSGISGDTIPIEARIVAVADVFDAVTTDRAYRKGHTREAGIDILLSMKDRHLDPRITDLFIARIREASDDHEDPSGGDTCQ